MKRCFYFFLGLIAAILLSLVSEPRDREQRIPVSLADTADIPAQGQGHLITEAAEPVSLTQKSK